MHFVELILQSYKVFHPFSAELSFVLFYLDRLGWWWRGWGEKGCNFTLKFQARDSAVNKRTAKKA